MSDLQHSTTAARDAFVPCAERIELAHGATHGMEALIDLIIQQSGDADSLAVHELACRAAQLNSLAMSALGDDMETLDSLRGRRLDLYRFAGRD